MNRNGEMLATLRAETGVLSLTDGEESDGVGVKRIWEVVVCVPDSDISAFGVSGSFILLDIGGPS